MRTCCRNPPQSTHDSLAAALHGLRKHPGAPRVAQTLRHRQGAGVVRDEKEPMKSYDLVVISKGLARANLRKNLRNTPRHRSCPDAPSGVNVQQRTAVPTRGTEPSDDQCRQWCRIRDGRRPYADRLADSVEIRPSRNSRTTLSLDPRSCLSAMRDEAVRGRTLQACTRESSIVS